MRCNRLILQGNFEFFAGQSSQHFTRSDILSVPAPDGATSGAGLVMESNRRRAVRGSSFRDFPLVPTHGWLAVGYMTALLSKISEGCGFAAQLCGRAAPFLAEMARFFLPSPRRGLSPRRGEGKVGVYGRVPGRRSQPA